MVYGIGIDIVEIDRFERALARWGNRLCERIFTPRELSACGNRVRPGRHLAVRFAAKEAFLKAAGIGMFQGVAWREIEILNDSSGRPYLQISGKADRICQDRGINKMLLSMSHEANYGVANVLLEADGKPHTV